MRTANSPLLGATLTSFFNDHLKLQKGLRPNSVTSYADAIRLFLQFVSKSVGKRITHLMLDELDADIVSAFLNSLEESRGNTAQSRNQRLAALRTFFEYVARRFPERLGEAQKVATIPRKRTRLPETLYLERDEVNGALAAVPAGRRQSLRDRTLLMFLYNTGARVQEAAGLRVKDIQFDPVPLVRLHGKGDKWRSCPIWEETAALLKGLLVEQQRAVVANQLVFTGPNGTALTRFGIYKIVRRHTGQLVKIGADGKPRHISPHTWRHSTAVHLLESGVEVNVIRAWLGHASLETTNRYAEITIRTKQAALEKCVPPATEDQRMPRKAPWHTDSDLLNWLHSL